jgi:hypothetical protein
MNGTDRLSRRTSPGRDPVLLAIQAACAGFAVVLVVLAIHLIGHARAQAAHPCPSWNFPVLTPTGWGCAQSAPFGFKTVQSK